MATPNSRETLIDYAFRRLGAPVIEINVDYAQAEERLDDALQYFSERHFDGVERCIFSYKVTQSDIDNKYIDTTSLGKAVGYGDTEGPNGNNLLSVTRVLRFGNLANQSMFDVRYQLALTDYFGVNRGLGFQSSLGLAGYDSTMRYIKLVEQFFQPEHILHFSKVTKRLHMDMKWKDEISSGDYVIIEGYASLDPAIYTDIFNDMYLKRYATALIKRQWGANLSKFSGVEMLGGVTMNGSEIYSQAQEELTRLEEQIQLAFELPVNYMMG